MKYDFVIVGGGLSGSILAYTLSEKYKQNILLVDNNLYRSSSLVAAGIFNPITGKRLKKSWLADILFPFLHNFYPAVEKHLHTHFFYNHKIYKPFDSVMEQNYWGAQSADPAYKNYISLNFENKQEGIIKNEFGGMEINYSGWLDCEGFISAVKQHFIERMAYVNAIFEPDDFQDEKIIYCEGFQAAYNPLWSWLPWRLTKGEVLIIQNKKLNVKNIINKSAFVCPTIVKGTFKAGSTYSWDQMDDISTEEARIDIKERIDSFLKNESEIIGQEAGIRPTVEKRKPFIGQHPTEKNMFIFNGFGSKTVSLAPYFATEMAEFLLNNKKLNAEVDIERYDFIKSN